MGEASQPGRDTPIKKPTSATPASNEIEQQPSAQGAAAAANNSVEAASIGVIQAVTIVSPTNVKRTIPNKPKTVDSVNLVNVKKTAVVVKGKQVPAHVPIANQAPLTLNEE